MIEVRNPRPDELDEMLSVMCEAFNLPFGPARDVFYRDPYFDVKHKRILTVQGRITSCLTIVDAPVRIGSAIVRTAGIAGVATRLADRKRGYATRLLDDAVNMLCKEGYGLAALFALSPDFYKRQKWEQASSQVQVSVAPASLPRTKEGRYVRPGLPSDLEDFIRLYDRWSADRTGTRLRDEKRWRYLFEHVKHRVIYKRRDAEGYALYDVREVEGKRSSLRLHEIVAFTEAAQRGLHAHLAQRTDCERIEYAAGFREVEQSGLIRGSGESGPHKPPAYSLSITPGPLVKVLSFFRCIEELCQNWEGFDGKVTLVMRERGADRQGCSSVTLEGEGGEILVREADGVSSPRSFIEGDRKGWSAVIAGRLSLEDAVAQGKLRAASEAAAVRAAPLFPRREFIIPTADHF